MKKLESFLNKSKQKIWATNTFIIKKIEYI